MRLGSELESDLGRLVHAITSVEGVVAVILFGSRAKGDYDEYSDYDLLVVFETDKVMWKNRRRLYENTGKLGLFTQVLTRSVKELEEKTEPTFLQMYSSTVGFSICVTRLWLLLLLKILDLWLW
jgi:predicted nucleotidyltransferase